jgi:DNA-binding response OmpR family regulator
MAADIVQSLLCILIVAIAFSSGRSFSGCGGQRRRPIRIQSSATETSLVRRDNESSRRWILLVEDEGDLRSAIGKYLAKEGYVVTGVSDARSAILVCRGIVRPRFKFDPSTNNLTTMPNTSTHIPDCVVLDIQMVGSMNGLGLLKFIRSDPMLASLPVVLITAKGKVEDRIVGYELGADAYLPKPFDPDELVSIVNGLLMRDKMTMDRDAGPSLNNKTTNNAVYGDLKRELKEIKALLSLDVHSPGKSEMSVDSLRRDILEIKDAIKSDVNQSTPSTKQDHERYNYESLSVLTPGESKFRSILTVLHSMSLLINTIFFITNS